MREPSPTRSTCCKPTRRAAAAIPGLLAIDGFCEVNRLPLSTHCGPALHLHAAAACLRLRHMEYFHDHVRIERMLFDGVVEPVAGTLRPDRSRPGHGLAFKHADARHFATLARSARSFSCSSI